MGPANSTFSFAAARRAHAYTPHEYIAVLQPPSFPTLWATARRGTACAQRGHSANSPSEDSDVVASDESDVVASDDADVVASVNADVVASNGSDAW